MTAGLRRSLRRVRTLSAEERKLTAEAALLLSAAAVLRRVLPIRRLLILQIPSALHAARRDAQSPGLAIAAIGRASRLLRLTNCLVTASALRLLLARRGLDSTLHIGVRKAGSQALAAHAWLSTEDGVVFGDPGPDTVYSEIFRARRGAESSARPRPFRR